MIFESTVDVCALFSHMQKGNGGAAHSCKTLKQNVNGDKTALGQSQKSKSNIIFVKTFCLFVKFNCR